MNQIGHLGSSLLLLPAAFVLLMCLAGAGRRRDAFALAVALLIAIVIIVGAKLAFYPCARTAASVESPSGHASLATAFYGILALLAAAGRGLRVRLALYMSAALLAVLIGVSRVEVYAHTFAEVAVGIALGFVPLMAFVVLRAEPKRLRVASRTIVFATPVVLILGMVALVLGRHWTPEPYIDAGARRLNALLQVCGRTPGGLSASDLRRERFSRMHGSWSFHPTLSSFWGAART